MSKICVGPCPDQEVLGTLQRLRPSTQTSAVIPCPRRSEPRSCDIQQATLVLKEKELAHLRSHAKKIYCKHIFGRALRAVRHLLARAIKTARADHALLSCCNSRVSKLSRLLYSGAFEPIETALLITPSGGKGVCYRSAISVPALLIGTAGVGIRRGVMRSLCRGERRLKFAEESHRHPLLERHVSALYIQKDGIIRHK